MNNDINYCYRKSFYGGRNTAARIIDFILVGFLIFSGCYGIIRTRLPRGIFTVIIALSLTMVIAIAHRIITVLRMNKHIAKLRSSTRNMLEDQALMFIPPSEYEEYIRSAVNTECYIIQKAEKVNCDDVYRAARYAKCHGYSKLSIVTSSQPTCEAIEVAKRIYETRICFKDARSIVYNSPNAPTVSEDDIDRAIMLRYGKKRRKGIRSNFKRGSISHRSRQYFVVGGILMALSLVMKHSIFIRLIASIALMLSALMRFTHGNNSKAENQAEPR